MKRILLIGTITLLIYGCKSKSARVYTVQRVNWTVDIPEKFAVMDSNQLFQLYRRVGDSLNRTKDTPIDMGYFSPILNISSSKAGQFNNISVTAFPYFKNFDTAKKSESTNLMASILKGARYQTPDSKIDTSSSKEVIAGQLFDAYRTIITDPNNRIANITSYYLIHRGYMLGITLSTTDSSVGAELKQILNTSKFN